MTAGQTLNEKMQGKGEFFHLEDRASDHLFIERVWRCHTDRGDTFLSVAANSFEMVLTRLRGKSFLTLRGPETTVTPVDCPAQRHFLRSTGVTYAKFRQIERARYATILLREGVPILDVVSRLSYFDQAHLTRSLRRFIGEAPTKIMQRPSQLSFLYKTEFPPIVDSRT